MILFIALVVWLLVTVLAFMKDEYGDANPLLGGASGLGFVVLGIWFIIVMVGYIGAKSELKVIEQKIATIQEMNEERIKSVLPILEKYPELEKEIVSGIDPNNFAVIGSVYPTLQSNAVYQEQANVVKENIKKVEDLKILKLDQDKTMYQVQMQIWFLK